MKCMYFATLAYCSHFAFNMHLPKLGHYVYMCLEISLQHGGSQTESPFVYAYVSICCHYATFNLPYKVVSPEANYGMQMILLLSDFS